MRNYTIIAAVALAVVTSPVVANRPNETQYLSAKTPIGRLLADPEARAAINKRFPVLLQSKAVKSGMADRMTLRSLQRFKPKIFSDASLAAIDADFAQLANN